MRAIKGVFLVFLFCYNSFGAVAFVQASSGGAQGSSTTRTTSATATTAHNAIVACTRTTAVCTTTTTLADTAGNTYYEVGAVEVTGADCMRAFIAKDITANASNVVTMTAGSAVVFSYINALEFSGVDRDHPRDVGFSLGQAITANAAFNSDPFSTFVADEAVVACLQDNILNSTWTYSSGWTNTAAMTPTDNVLSAQYKIFSSLQSAISFNVQTNQSAAKTIIGVGLRGQESSKIRHAVTAQ